MIWIDRRDRSALRVIVLELAWRRSVRQFGRHFATHIAKAFGSSGWVRLGGASGARRQSAYPSCCTAANRRFGHVWTAPAMHEEFDYLRSVRVQSCIRLLSAAALTAGPDVIC